ncbi:TetR/AcrR family transcriptional regulator [Christiangramia echinicola]|uniref:DNA-binding transcriptional regulator, AcrR family n=1 Tax=Christiangramia echinicola TaxID=279359 RepID=A0A1H1SD90_9FLAO|nr:TetR/AcrR family transcriptional regulator [Christiangramia echinicola]SDS45891.1 DNA-binding transcriptional regulator, AcrR family [Christiangramia echinicola]
MEQELKTEATRKLITEKAFMQFYKNGFKATSVNEIMKATGLSKGAFYHNFKNKDELGVLVVKAELNSRIYEAMISPLFTKGEAKTILKRTFLTKFQAFTSDEKLMGCPVNNLINEIGGSQNLLNEALKELIDTWVKAVVEIIERGHEDGSIKPETNPQQAAIYLVSSFEGMRGIRKLYNDDTNWNAYRAALENYIDQL